MNSEEIKSILPADKIYSDTLSPAMKQIGKALENVVKTSRFLLSPIDYLAAYSDRWERYLQKVSNKVEEGNLVEGHPQIVIPVIEGLTLSYENTLLSELFINLLANSIDKTKQDLAHPAFPNIIKQLSHDEAVILYFLKKKSYEVVQRSELNSEGTMFLEGITTFEEFPIDKLQYPQHIWIYLDHLSSLNIAGTFITKQEAKYDENTNKQIGVRICSERKLLEFGNLFASACIPDNFEIH